MWALELENPKYISQTYTYQACDHKSYFLEEKSSNKTYPEKGLRLQH
jgi:hypothetical protein